MGGGNVHKSAFSIFGSFAAAAALFASGGARAENLPPRPVDAPAELVDATGSLPSGTLATAGRTDMAAKVTLGTGPARVTIGGARGMARVTIAGALDGAQVIASRTSDIVGRPIDIFRPIGMGSNSLAGVPSGMPVASRRITSGFGYRTHPILGGRRAHSGVDLAAAHGSPVVATADGIVGEADWRGGYGLLVAVESGGVETRYGHLSRLNVVAGQRVRRGDVIGYVGSTGRSTGPHLHYEVRVNGQAVDPLRTKVK